VGKFVVSVEAKNSFHYAKAQLLLILIETLDFENLLLMIRDEVPFRCDRFPCFYCIVTCGKCMTFLFSSFSWAYISFYFCSSRGCSAFSIGDILEMDVEISKLLEFSMVESGPLILAWAVFLCLVQSLPGSNDNLVTMIFYLILYIAFTAGNDCISHYYECYQELDHTSYAQPAFEFAPFNYLLGFLCTSIFRESDVSVI
jgi:nuclear pore complex protein Nup188